MLGNLSRSISSWLCGLCASILLLLLSDLALAEDSKAYEILTKQQTIDIHKLLGLKLGETATIEIRAFDGTEQTLIPYGNKVTNIDLKSEKNLPTATIYDIVPTTYLRYKINPCCLVKVGGSYRKQWFPPPYQTCPPPPTTWGTTSDSQATCH